MLKIIRAYLGILEYYFPGKCDSKLASSTPGAPPGGEIEGRPKRERWHDNDEPNSTNELNLVAWAVRQCRWARCFSPSSRCLLISSRLLLNLWNTPTKFRIYIGTMEDFFLKRRTGGIPKLLLLALLLKYQIAVKIKPLYLTHYCTYESETITEVWTVSLSWILSFLFFFF